MKRFLPIKRNFAFLLALCLGSGTAYAYDFYKNCSTGQRLYYNIISSANHYVEITYPGTSSNPWGGYTQPSGNITLPSTVTYNGVTYTVTKIGNRAFYQCEGLTGALTIPNSVTTIGNYAFYDCYHFTGRLILGNSVTTIGDWAFASCYLPGYNPTSFTGDLVIPNSVTSIGSNAFYYSYIVNGTLTLGDHVNTIGENAFGACSGFTGSLNIPNSVTTIGAAAFGGCSGFTGTLTVGTGVTSLGWYAFNQCSGFTHVKYNATNCANISSDDTPFIGCGSTLTIGSNVVRIPSYMFDESNFTYVNYNATNCADASTPSPFKDCSGILVIGNNVTRIPAYMFYDCVYFTSLTIGNSVNEIGNCAFRYCSASSGLSGNLVIPNSVTTIGAYAFEDCSHYSGYTLTIGTGVTSIGKGAFRLCDFAQVNYNATNCADVTSTDKPFEFCGGILNIGSNVKRIPSYMFYNCTDFTGSLTIPNSVTSIGNSAFRNCDGFTGTLTLGNNLNVIGNYAFCQCDSFTGSLSIPNSVTSIGNYAFYGCCRFTGSLYIGNSVNTIGNYAFYSCSLNNNYGFTGTLTIPNSVNTIGSNAFAYDYFTSLNIGSEVNTTGYRAFFYCTNLSSITVKRETPPSLGSEAFENVSTTMPVYVPCSALEDYQAASGWSAFTNYQCNPMVTVTAVPTAGGTVTGGGTYVNGTSVTVMATPNSNYLFMNWSKNGTVVSSNASYTFTVTEDTNLEAVFMSQSDAGDIIGEATGVNQYLPSFSYYKYSLTEQIYTASEMGGSNTITSISFFNEGDKETRTYEIYMKHTNKTSFSSTTDWISVTSSNKVYSGEVTMRTGQWNTIELDTPFNYNGTSNLLIVVDDNSGTYTGLPHMSCRVFEANGNQAIRVYSDVSNYNPVAPPTSYSSNEYAAVHSVKNQIMLNREVYDITANSSKTSGGTVSGWGQYGRGDLCRLKATANSGYTFMDWTDDAGVVVSTDANYSFIVTGNRSLTANFMSGTNLCSLTFDLYDSYGDGWNGNYLVVDYENGMTKKLAVPSGKNAIYTLPVEDGSHIELGWIMGSWTYECSFAVSYTEGDLIYMGSSMNQNFEYGFDMDCAGQSSELTYLGNHGNANNNYLPSYSYYNYSLTEQIYTADEIGTSGIINSIAFYNAGTQAKTRNYKIYLATTNKTSFSNATDWIATSNATLVFNGNVTMHSGRWTPIVFNTPFDYDGSSNLVLIVDDNTGSYTGSPYMACLVYPASGFQTLRIFSDDINYNPSSPSSYTGTLQNVKNQIMLNIKPCVEPFDLEVTDITATSATVGWVSNHYSFELQYREMGPNNDFEYGLGLWTGIDADGDGHGWYRSTGNSYAHGHDESEGFAASASWYSGTILTPDNYLVSPQVILGGSISFWARGEDASYAAEHFGVAVSTNSNTNPSDFTTIQEWTMTAKSGGNRTGYSRDGGNRDIPGGWYQYTVDLSTYAGQIGYVAIRHFNCTDMYRLNVDDITIVQPGVNSSWTIINYASNPYALTNLTPETQYEVRVLSLCGGMYYSDWAYTTFTTPGVTQTIALAAGWNWFSTYLDITLDDLKAALVSTGNTTITIKSKNQNTYYQNGIWRGNLNFDVAMMYKIYVSAACEISFEDMPIHPLEHSIIIHNGPNWIGFPLSESMTLDDAFAGFADNGDVIKHKGGSANYLNGHWRGAFNLEPGQGYIYKSNMVGDRLLTFPTSAK